jgi:cytochrome P450
MAFNPFSPEFQEDPYPAYAELRADDPVSHQEGFNSWLISRYDDVAYVLKNPTLFSSSAIGMQIDGKQTRTIINTDPPDHTKMRNLVNRAFTPRMVLDMEPRIREITSGLLDGVVPSGQMDLVEDLAVPLPVTVIAELLGVDPSRREEFKRWSDSVISQSSSANGDRQEPGLDLEQFIGYFRDVIEQRRRRPEGDLISAVVAAEEGELKLTPEEVLAFVGLLLIAGNETTTNLISNAMLALFEHPEQLGAVAADGSLIPNMLEEALRYDAPVQFLFRTATDDVEVGGRLIPKGSGVVPIYASANRDELRFENADRFDISRNASGHLAFGLGVHFCLGAPLARLEARVAFEELFARTGELRLSGDVERLTSLFLRGLRHMPLAFAPVAAAV